MYKWNNIQQSNWMPFCFVRFIEKKQLRTHEITSWFLVECEKNISINIVQNKHPIDIKRNENKHEKSVHLCKMVCWCWNSGRADNTTKLTKNKEGERRLSINTGIALSSFQ